METKTFDFLEYAAGTNYPKDIVVIYTDVDAAYQMGLIEKELAEVVDDKEVAKLEKKYDLLKKQLKKSKIEFHLQGIPLQREKKYTTIADEKFGKEDSDDKDMWLGRAFVAAHIQKIVNAEGAEDTSAWDADRLEVAFNMLTLEGTERLYKVANRLTMRTDIFENVEVNPDF